MQEIDRQQEIAMTKQAKMLGYNADKFLNYTWEWEWRMNEKIGLYEPKNITPCCPNPDCNLSPMAIVSSSGLTTHRSYCKNCARYYEIVAFGFGNIIHEVESHIQNRVEEL